MRLRLNTFVAFIVLQIILVSGELFGSKALCIECDGDVFSTSLLTQNNEVDYDSYESDWGENRARESSPNAMDSANDREDFPGVLVSDDSISPHEHFSVGHFGRIPQAKG